MVDKQKLKIKISNAIDKLIDSTESIGDIKFFEINIKHTDGDISISLINKYKQKL
ncbi:hypothetical protein [Clostridium tyrobutyricum]|uniref:hypothetical protein n=1 Tax=Clostridium tyrobutyricum TaxID=1519 RepID=UPI001C38CBA3|nr:hypothetical protein [Clostridium tyrobutyricum]MBV4417185.1 hypothetical protein [Clostridium tyrobutyricum]